MQRRCWVSADYGAFQSFLSFYPKERLGLFGLGAICREAPEKKNSFYSYIFFE